MKNRVVINDEGQLKVESLYPIDIKINGVVIGKVLAFIPRGNYIPVEVK